MTNVKKQFLVSRQFGTVGDLVAFLQTLDQSAKFVVYDGPFDQDFCLDIHEWQFNDKPACWFNVSLHEWFGDYGEEDAFGESEFRFHADSAEKFGNIPDELVEKEE